MRKKNGTRMIAFALIIGLLAAIPASTQVVSTGGSVPDEGADLRMVVLINRLELTKEQMQTIHDALAGVIAEIDALDSRRAEFYDEMLRFDGTADELEQALSAFREEMSAAAEGLRSDISSAIDEIATTLTMKQGEILRRAIPGLFARGEATPRFGMEGMIPPGRPGEERGPAFGRGADDRAGIRGAIAQRMKDRLQAGAERGRGFASRPVGRGDGGERGPIGKPDGRKVDLLRLFVETLELKMSYTE